MGDALRSDASARSGRRPDRWSLAKSRPSQPSTSSLAAPGRSAMMAKGQHTEEVMGEVLGLTGADIAALHAAGAI